MKRATRIGSICLLILPFVLNACGLAVSPTPTPPPVAQRPLKIGWDIWAGYYPLLIAAEKGFFTKHNVQVEPVQIENNTGLARLETGELDGLLMALPYALQTDATAPDSIRVVLAVDYSDGADAVIAGASIAGPADLRGRRIGTMLGSFSELLIRSMLQQHNLLAQDVTLVNTDVAEVPAALANANIQAGHTWEPFASDALQHGGHVIFSSADVPGLITDVLAMRAEATKMRPQDIRALILAWFDAVDYWQAHPTEGNAIIAKATGLQESEISLDGIKLLTLADNRQAFTMSDATLSLYASSKLTKDFLIGTGSLTTAPDEQRVLDKTFLP